MYASGVRPVFLTAEKALLFCSMRPGRPISKKDFCPMQCHPDLSKKSKLKDKNVKLFYKNCKQGSYPVFYSHTGYCGVSRTGVWKGADWRLAWKERFCP